jgi:hypothetical protein
MLIWLGSIMFSHAWHAADENFCSCPSLFGAWAQLLLQEKLAQG